MKDLCVVITLEKRQSHKMIIHIDKEEVTILEIKIVTLGEKDYNTKIYDLYLRLCAEGIIN